MPVTVIAGPPGPQSANCTFVNDSGLLGGALNQGSTITVTEAAGSGTTLTALTCPSCGAGGLTADLITRKATLSGPNGLLPSVNAVVFTNVDYVCRDVEASRKGNSDKGPKSELSRPDCIQRSVRYDFDGDGKADPAIFTPSEARLTVATSADDYMHHSLNIFGLATDKLVPADYDGDGKNDIAVWRPSNGNWYVAGTAGIYQVHQWGEPGDIPQVGDYDGDGKSDFVVWRPSTGTWYMKNSQEGFRIFQFGIATDKPKAADYDGDGKTDAGVFRRGTWYTLQSTQGFRVTNFGQSRDIPVPGDYDGDRAADLAVYRNGTWYIHTGTVYSVRQWGSATDLPVPADYDGDGKTDLAIFRPSEGNWYIRRSAVSEDGPLTVALGSSTDIPLQLPQ